jgi:hypothetical protein
MNYGVESELLVVSNERKKLFENILNKSIVSNHKQMKINVDLALIVKINDRKHYFVISETSKMIIDLTRNINFCYSYQYLQKNVQIFMNDYE